MSEKRKTFWLIEGFSVDQNKVIIRELFKTEEETKQFCEERRNAILKYSYTDIDLCPKT